MLAVKRTLDEASAAVESLHGALAAQHELEQLLKQGRTHLQDLQTRLQHAEEQREQYRAELVESRTAHQRDVEQLQRQRDEQAAAHTQFAEERADERTTLTRLLNEAASKEREMIEECDALLQQIEALRDAGMRAAVARARDHSGARKTSISRLRDRQNNALYCRLGFKPRDESTFPTLSLSLRRLNPVRCGCATRSRAHRASKGTGTMSLDAVNPATGELRRDVRRNDAGRDRCGG